jgi:hypothetical protein
MRMLQLIVADKIKGADMGIPDMLVAILKEIAEANGAELDTPEGIDEVMTRIAPKSTPCGMLETRCVICCPCGEPIPLQISQPKINSDEVRKLAAELPEADIHDKTKNGIGNEPKDSGALVATNYGHTIEHCEKCGRRFIVTLEMNCANISNEVKLPWGDLEVPESPSSGLSPMTNVDDNGTVH